MAKKKAQLNEPEKFLSEPRPEWSIGDARTRFSELFRDALEAPQVVRDKKTNADDKAVAVVSLVFLNGILKMGVSRYQEMRVEEDERERSFREVLNALRTDALEAARLDGVSDPASENFLLRRESSRALPVFGDKDD